MAAKLANDQRQVLAAILAGAKRAGASPKEVKAAVQTGIVESNLRNLGHGDADSQGWRQERASLYKDPRNLRASIDRFFNETRAVKGKYGRAGELAAAVQRPAAQYRGRYEDNSAYAEALLRQYGGAGASASSSSSPFVGSAQRSVTTTSVDEQGLKRATGEAALGRLFAQRRPQGLLTKLGALRTTNPDPAEFTSTSQRLTSGSESPAEPRTNGGTVSGKGRPSNQLLELFYDPLGGIKNGREIGAIGGHGDHVHVASGPKQLRALKRLAIDMGLTITSEDEGYPGDGVHTDTSLHYKGKAIDVGGDPKKMRAYAQAIKRRYGVK